MQAAGRGDKMAATTTISLVSGAQISSSLPPYPPRRGRAFLCRAAGRAWEGAARTQHEAARAGVRGVPARGLAVVGRGRGCSGDAVLFDPWLGKWLVPNSREAGLWVGWQVPRCRPEQGRAAPRSLCRSPRLARGGVGLSACLCRGCPVSFSASARRGLPGPVPVPGGGPRRAGAGLLRAGLLGSAARSGWEAPSEAP